MFIKKLLVERSYIRCFIFLAGLVVLFSMLSPHFLSPQNIENILTASTVTGLLALGVTFVIASGGIDLSIASVMALAGTLCATVVQNSTISSPVALLLCLSVGALCGLFTALLINITRAPSFIISLGMLSVARAIAYIASDGMPVYGLPEQITELGQGRVCGVAGPVLILIIATAVAFILLHKIRFGLHALILGDNPFAAEAMGIRIRTLRYQIYGLCGVYAGLAGFVFMARTNAGDPTAGQNYELVAITAVILGGAKLFGGHATIAGSVLGVLCLGVLQNGLNLLAVGTYYQVLFVGVVLIAAALVERVGRSRDERT